MVNTNLANVARNRTVAVVGGGAAGSLVANAFARAEPPGPTTVLVIEPRPALGAGVAYSSEFAGHLLNVRADRLGASPECPDGFVEWLHRRGQPTAAPGDFVPRALYGRYLADTVQATFAASRVATMVHLRDTVRELRRTAEGFDLKMAEGGVRRTVAAVVLAVGNVAARDDWAPAALRQSDRFIADPWAPGARDRASRARSALLVGTGLTMVDVALELAGPRRQLIAVSPSAQLPEAHRSAPLAPSPPPPELRQCGEPAAMFATIRAHMDRCRAEYGDWRPAIDGLRPVTPALWQSLTDEHKRRALRDYRSWWNRHRHRMAPHIGPALRQMRADGQLHVRRGEVAEAHDMAAGLRITLTDGAVLTVDVVVNCTGQQTDLRNLDHALLRSLLDTGTARPGPAGLGLDTDRHGQLLDRDGKGVPGLYTLGATRVGQLWETTAIPEIRDQAVEIAFGLRHHLTRRAATHRPRRRQPGAPGTAHQQWETRGMRMSAKAEYAIRAMVQLATLGEDELAKLDDVATAQGIPHQFLVDILAALRSSRLVRSHRGRDGGYQLARPATEITVADVLRSIDGPLASVRDIALGELPYTGPTAKLTDVWMALRASMRLVLEQTSLADVVSGRLPEHVITLAKDYRSQQAERYP